MESYISKTNVLKQSLLQKLSCAVLYSVFSHVVLVFLYAFVVNLTWDTSEWFRTITDNITSFSTWLYIIPFTSIIFAQVVICANVYMLKSAYQATRLKKLISVISLRIFILGLLHIVIGGVEIWLYLFLSKSKYKDVYITCSNSKFCLQEGSIFLILSGLWTGLYYFVCCRMTDRSIKFPVVHQWKIQQYKVKILPLIQQSNRAAIFPTACYFILYYLFGSYIKKMCGNYFHLHLQNDYVTMPLYISAWIFATLYIINMNLMKFFFELFLTEPFMHIDNMSLSEALLTKNMPILQHLACLDLYLLSKWSPTRRQALFSLSQPGSHPHAWNGVFQASIQIIAEFVEILNRSSDILLNKNDVKPSTNQNETIIQRPQSPLLFQSPLINKYEHLNNTSFLMQSQVDSFVQVTVEPKRISFTEIFDSIIKGCSNLIAKAVTTLQNLKYVKYLIGELQEVHIEQCLRNGQLIIWTSQGMANMAVASFHEDPYGIVQKDLPILIKTLVDLKQSVEKLNKLPMFSRKSNEFNNFSYKMKSGVYSSVKLSLGNICNRFGKYIKDISLTKDVVFQLQNYT